MAWKPFSSKIEKRILNAIAEAEETCSGEIRVHVDQYCKGDPIFKATNLFHHLEMDQTSLHNGVLIYVALDDKKFSILGDSGIDAKVPDDFWEDIKERMIGKFKANDPVGAIVTAIKLAGKQLQTYFPGDKSKGNELSDEISYGS